MMKTTKILCMLVLLLIWLCQISPTSSQEQQQEDLLCEYHPYQQYSREKGRCDCLPGLYGWGCQMCTNDLSCQQLQPTTPGVYCNHELVYRNNIPNKTYSCTLDDELAALFTNGAWDIQCYQSSNSCQMALRKESDDINYDLNNDMPWSESVGSNPHVINCNLTECVFDDNSANGKCQNINCTCGTNRCNGLVQSTVEMTLSGKPVVVTVDTNTNHLQMDIQGSFLPLGVTCNASACATLDDVDGTNGTSTTSDENDNGGLVNLLEDKFQNDWRGITAVCIVMLFLLSLLFLLIVSCYACYHVRMNDNNNKSNNSNSSDTTTKSKSNNGDVNADGKNENLDVVGVGNGGGGGFNDNEKDKNDNVNEGDNVFDVDDEDEETGIPSPKIGKSDDTELSPSSTTPPSTPLPQEQQEQERRRGDVLEFHNVTMKVVTNSSRNASSNHPNNGSFAGAMTPTSSTASTAHTNTKYILNDVSGKVESGEILAILGSSGAGKSTLLNILAGMPPVSSSSLLPTLDNGISLSGTVTLNGMKRDSKTFQQRTSYVEHSAYDGLFSTLTVREHIEYSALLRLPMTCTIQQKLSKVDSIMKQLQLTHIQNCRVSGSGGGGGGRGAGRVSSESSNNDDNGSSTTRSSNNNNTNQGGRISTGERRRVLIGMELVVSPSILFLDEPTTGLDSSTAKTVVSLLHDLTRTSAVRTMIIMSIHQPSAQCFQLFDNVIVLSKRGGRMIYNGPSRDALEACETSGYPLRNAHDNIADHLLDTAASFHDYDETGNNNNNNGSFSSKIEQLHQEGVIPFRTASSSKISTPQSRKVETNFDNNGKDHQQNVETKRLSPTKSSPRARGAAGDERNDIHGDDVTSRGRSSIAFEIQILLNRTVSNLFRNQSMVLMHCTLSILLGVLAGLIFQNVTNDLAGFQNRTGAIYFALIFFSISSLSSIDLFLNEERLIFLREAGSNYYKCITYFMIKFVLDALSLRLLPSTFFAFIFYWTMGLNRLFTKFIIFWLTLSLFNLAAGSIAICISIITRNVGVANLVTTTSFLIMLLFGGLFANVDTLSSGISWVRYLSIFNYAFEIMMTNELEGLVLSFDAPNYPALPVKGEIFLLTLGLDIDNQVRDIFGLFAIAVGCNIIAYLVLTLSIPTMKDILEASP